MGFCFKDTETTEIYTRSRHDALPISNAPLLARLEQVNAALQALCNQRGCAFISTARPPVTDESGSLNPAMAADRLHLGPQGYAHLARWLTEDGGALGQLLQTD